VAEGGAIGEGEERGSDVVQVAWQGELLRVNGPAGPPSGFQDEDAPAVPGQRGRGYQPVRPGPDHDRVRVLGHRILLWSLSRPDLECGEVSPLWILVSMASGRGKKASKAAIPRRTPNRALPLARG